MSTHIKQIKKSTSTITSPDGKEIAVREIIIPTDDKLISEWAKHFRKQYICDEELVELVDGTGLENGEFLENIIFPDGKIKPGPSIRSGDFTEVLLSDYLEYVENFWVPRNRFPFKATRNESVKGTDIVGIKFKVDGETSSDDILAIMESKARLSTKNDETLQDAINHSGKDYLRIAHTLNAIKRRYIQTGDKVNGDKIKRFQNLEDHPFKEVYGAVAFCTTDSLDESDLFDVDESNHPKKDDLHLLVFHGSELMKFVHKLYRRAIDEAG